MRIAPTQSTSSIWIASIAVCCTFLHSGTARAQIVGTNNDLLDDQTTISTKVLDVRNYVTLPNNGSLGNLTTAQILSMTKRPGDTGAFYTTSQDGRIHRITDNGSGQGVATEWFNVNSSINITSNNSFHGGLRAIAFHPDFDKAGSAGHGKFYGSMMAANASASANFIGTSAGAHEGVVAEWTYDFGSGTAGQFRELFRVKNPVFDHPIKSLSFNTAAAVGDADYGLLYVAQGDGSIFNQSTGTGLDTTNALGKILRVDPVDPDGAGPLRYSTPGNALALDGDANTLAEVYSYGHRNPHNLTFTKDASGQSRLIVAEIGQDNMEEVNVVVNGGNYGWGDREGTFVKLKDEPGLRANGYGVRPDTGNPPGDQNSAGLLIGDDGGNNFIYPALQLDHNDPTDGNLIGIAGGPVIDGRYYYGNFAGNGVAQGGQLYSVSVEELFGQNTSLGLGQTVDDLSWIDDHEQHLLSFDHDNDVGTAPLMFSDFADLLSHPSLLGGNQNRSDFRFGVAPDGNLLVSSKRTGSVFLISNAVAAVPEPSSLAVLSFGIGLAALRRRKRKTDHQSVAS